MENFIMKILFTRHGESQANILHEISNRGLRHPLTQNGREQAFLVAQKLQDQHISYIYSSPVLRAIETSVIIANRLCVEYEITEGLREYDMGYLEGRADEETWRLWQELFDDWISDQDRERRVQDGENFYDVQKRFVSFINGLIQVHQGTDATLLCIGHGGLYWMMLPLVLENVDAAFIQEHGAFPYASWITSELRQEKLVCLEWNEVPMNI
jgi:broad specificity phosphatase PhoE